ncbi:hypothetical protein [Moorena sp. SIO4G3]|uniref:hypothetical protein n=1 Tax=Moorena sp. SIO4G3 TaxID=2607821 RepID=UPI001428FB17|nr:hypothetical protein [Moorena sp. SIO4G3]NEO80307.1 hypothetical protein [Moorena sp. SIO4G3]
MGDFESFITPQIWHNHTQNQQGHLSPYLPTLFPLLPIPCSLLPAPCSLLPTPYSLLPYN